MASSGNFPIWSSLFYNTETGSLKNASYTFDGSTNGTSALTDFAIPVGTKFYAEIIAKLGSNYYNIFGIAPPTMDVHDYARNLANVYAIEQRTDPGAYKTNSISNTTVGSLSSSQGDLDTQVITYGIAVNRVDNEIKLYLNNTLKYTLSIPSTGEYHFMCSFTGGDGATSVRYHFNGGQDSTGAGDTTAGTQKDENGFGEFQYAPPSGFLAPCSANLPTSSDIDPGGDDGADENPTKHFGVITYTGTGSSRTISGLGFQPDLIWAKTTSTSSRHYLVDSNRGFTKYLHSEDTYSEGTSSDGVTSANSDGFVIGGSLDYVNYSGRTFVAWCWRANGGTTSSNSNGSITATVQANTKAGFSIANYTSPGSGTNHTVGHGLSGVDFIITKNRDQTFNWYCFHKTSPNYTYRLNEGSRHSYSNWSMGATTWGSEDGYTHNGTQNWIAYCWQNVEGMQKFGSYTGNGNSDGPFVYTGFRPRMLFTHLDNSTSGWRVRDTERSPNNPTTTIIWWNLEFSNYTNSSQYPFDILSNGFKLRTSTSDFNGSGSTYFYGAWGDVPYKYNNPF